MPQYTQYPYSPYGYHRDDEYIQKLEERIEKLEKRIAQLTQALQEKSKS